MTAHAKVAGEIALLSARDFDRMIEAGILVDRDVELRDGVLIEMAPEHMPHARVKSRLAACLFKSLDRLGRKDLEAIIEVSVETSLQNVSQPDLVVVRADAPDGLLHGRDVILAVEIADSNRTRDLGWKAEQYALAGIGEYWVIDLKANAVVAHREPAEGDYKVVEVIRFDERLRSTAIDGLEVRVADLIS